VTFPFPRSDEVDRNSTAVAFGWITLSLNVPTHPLQENTWDSAALIMVAAGRIGTATVAMIVAGTTVTATTTDPIVIVTTIGTVIGTGGALHRDDTHLAEGVVPGVLVLQAQVVTSIMERALAGREEVTNSVSTQDVVEVSNEEEEK
jgi:hypothetical protein